MWIIGLDVIFYEYYDFKKYEKLYVVFFWLKIGIRECYLGVIFGVDIVV